MTVKNLDEMSKIKLTANVLFSGIGCQEMGIKNTRLFNLEVVNTSDINKDSILSYASIHCGLTNSMVEDYKDYPNKKEMANYLNKLNIGYEPLKNKPYDWNKLVNRKKKDLEKYWLACKLSNNLGDISKIESLSYADLWTVSFPCTDISNAGKMKGFSPDSNTRSSLLWENMRLLKASIDKGESPKFIMFENVKNLVSKKFKTDFDTLVEILSDLGFNTYWQVINACECGIPQHRERVFIICIRKDIDTGLFTFPKPFDNGKRLKDILDDNVDEKFFIRNEKANKLLKELEDFGYEC